MRELLFYDSTLRDGNHALSHQITKEQIHNYTKLAESSGIDIVEVGHGNGLAGSSFQVGMALLSDKEMFESAKANLDKTKLSTLVLPGFVSIKNDLKDAVDIGVDIFRVAVHCSEATLSVSYIDFIKSSGKDVYLALMMSHMVCKEELLKQAQIGVSYGADAIFLFDSAGYMTPQTVSEKISYLRAHLEKPVAFHAHNNLGLAVANTLSSIQSGATIADGCSRGFGAGAGNAQLEILAALLKREGYSFKARVDKVLDLADYAHAHLLKELPYSNSSSILGGVHGVFSGFKYQVQKIAKEHNLDVGEILQELGRQKVIAGQEDMILKIAMQIKGKI
ncbi:4-hydroxy-2-oxovalerate aldolase [bacterium]|nr:4-hydroxy-2-oxovalerate aldolase [bacterium]MBU1994484.1 4-hydroxy-2-oxovalerate aldolase [bacterium]